MDICVGVCTFKNTSYLPCTVLVTFEFFWRVPRPMLNMERALNAGLCGAHHAVWDQRRESFVWVGMEFLNIPY